MRKIGVLGVFVVALGCSDQDASQGGPTGATTTTSGAGGSSATATSATTGDVTTVGTGGSTTATSATSATTGPGTGGNGGNTGSTTGTSGTGGTVGTGGAPVDGGGGGGGSPGMVQCGSTNIDVSGFNAAESLVVGPEGTIYSCSRSAVLGRFAPPYTQPENNWLTIPNAQVFGIAFDPKKKILYAGARGTNRIYRIPVDAPNTMDTLAQTMGSNNGINGVTLGDDGAVYYGDQAGGHVWRLTPDDKMTAQVTAMPVNGANGIAFAPDGRLWVLSYSQPGAVTRFKVDANHKEVAGTRDSFKLPGNNADGITFDKSGNAYITAGGLYRVTPDGMATRLNASGGANVEFGAGALSCKLILWAGSPVHTMMNDAEGAIVPWHHL